MKGTQISALSRMIMNLSTYLLLGNWQSTGNIVRIFTIAMALKVKKTKKFF